MNDVKRIIIKILLQDSLKECNREYKNRYEFDDIIRIKTDPHKGFKYNYRYIRIHKYLSVFSLRKNENLFPLSNNY